MGHVTGRTCAERQRPHAGCADRPGFQADLRTVAFRRRAKARGGFPGPADSDHGQPPGGCQSETALTCQHARRDRPGARGRAGRPFTNAARFERVPVHKLGDAMADPILNKLKHHWNVSSRREFFTQAGSGLAGIALAAMMAEDGYAAGVDPLAPKKPHVTPRAKNVIFCFMECGPSQVDLFDPKPMLEKYALQPVPASFH